MREASKRSPAATPTVSTETDLNQPLSPAMSNVNNFIGGSFVPAVSRQTIDNINPATGEKYSSIPDSDRHDIDQAVAAAKEAYPRWSRLSVQERAACLNKVANLIEQKLDSLALAESIDNGKPVALARTVDIPRAAENFRFFAERIGTFFDENHLDEKKGIVSAVKRDPIGVVGCISPWNLPLYLLTWKIAPALAAGNCVVAKPSELTPMTASMLGEIFQEAGVPAGVFNVVHGYGSKAGAALCAHPDIKAISFTGGTKTGTEVKAVAEQLGKKVTLELG